MNPRGAGTTTDNALRELEDKKNIFEIKKMKGSKRIWDKATTIETKIQHSDK